MVVRALIILELKVPEATNAPGFNVQLEEPVDVQLSRTLSPLVMADALAFNTTLVGAVGAAFTVKLAS